MSTEIALPSATTLISPESVLNQVTQADVVRLLVFDYETAVKAEIERRQAQIRPLRAQLDAIFHATLRDVHAAVQADVMERAEALRTTIGSITDVPVEYETTPEDYLEPSLLSALAINEKYTQFPHLHAPNAWRRQRPNYTRDQGDRPRVDWTWWEIVEDWFAGITNGTLIQLGAAESATTSVRFRVDGTRVELRMLVTFNAPDLRLVQETYQQCRALERQSRALETQISNPVALERQMHAALTRRVLEGAGVSTADLLKRV